MRARAICRGSRLPRLYSETKLRATVSEEGSVTIRVRAGMIQRSFAVAFGLMSWALVVRAVDTKPDPTPDQLQSIVKSFTQKETEFAAARESYTYRQTSKISETEPPGGSY